MPSNGRSVGRPKKKSSWNAGLTQLKNEGVPVVDEYGKKIYITTSSRVVTPPTSSARPSAFEYVVDDYTPSISHAGNSPFHDGNPSMQDNSPRSYRFQDTASSGLLRASDPLVHLETRVGALNRETLALHNQANFIAERDVSQIRMVNDLSSSLESHGIIRQSSTESQNSTFSTYAQPALSRQYSESAPFQGSFDGNHGNFAQQTFATPPVCHQISNDPPQLFGKYQTHTSFGGPQRSLFGESAPQHQSTKTQFGSSTNNGFDNSPSLTCGIIRGTSRTSLFDGNSSQTTSSPFRSSANNNGFSASQASSGPFGASSYSPCRSSTNNGFSASQTSETVFGGKSHGGGFSGTSTTQPISRFGSLDGNVHFGLFSNH